VSTLYKVKEEARAAKERLLALDSKCASLHQKLDDTSQGYASLSAEHDELHLKYAKVQSKLTVATEGYAQLSDTHDNLRNRWQHTAAELDATHNALTAEHNARTLLENQMYGARFRKKFALEDAIGSHACSLKL
jgi:chromosome segregation ATPase